MLNTDLTDIDLEWLAELQKTKPEIKTLWYHRNDTSVAEVPSPQELTWDQLGLIWTRTDNQLTVKYTDNIKPFTPKIIK